MTSIKTQLPYEYYSLKFCEPKGEREYKIENLGLFIHCSTSYLFNIPCTVNNVFLHQIIFFFKFELQSSHKARNFFGTEENKGFFFTRVIKLCLKLISSSCYILLTIYLLFNFIFNLQVRFSEVTELSILLMR